MNVLLSGGRRRRRLVRSAARPAALRRRFFAAAAARPAAAAPRGAGDGDRARKTLRGSRRRRARRKRVRPARSSACSRAPPRTYEIMPLIWSALIALAAPWPLLVSHRTRRRSGFFSRNSRFFLSRFVSLSLPALRLAPDAAPAAPLQRASRGARTIRACAA